jgi:glycosyltransferase involved in cell wall biosynthesis
MKILFLDQFNDLGGAQQCLLDLLPAVLERGWEPVAMLPGDGVLGKRIRELGIEVLPVSSGPYNSGHKTTDDLKRFARDVRSAARQITRCRLERNIDLIYVNGPRLVPAAALAAGDARILFHCHSYLRPRPVEWITALSLRIAHARVIASSAFVAQPLKRWIPASRLHVVYNGVNGDGYCRKTQSDSFRIGIIGRIAPEKGQDMFLRAARILQSRLPNTEFVICGAPLFSGTAYQDEIESLALGLPVEFTGWRNDIASVLSKLDLVVVPSTSIDATPRVIPQSFAARVPIVAFANAGFRELIDDARTGYLLETRTPEALAAKMESVLTAGRLTEITDSARDEWSTRFSLESYRRNILRILDAS